MTKSTKRKEDKPAEAASAEQRKWQKLSQAVDLVGRVALCVAIVVVAIFCIQTVQDMRSTDHRRAEAKTAGDSHGTLEDVLNGDWQFAGMPWSVQISEMSAAAAGAALDAEVPELQALPVVATDGSQEFEMISSALEMLRAQSSREGQQIVYRVNSPVMQGKAYAPHAEPEQVQLIRVVQRLDEHRVNYIELVRKPAEFRQPENQRVLLPAAPQNQRLAVRHDAKGDLCAELIEMQTSFADLQATWEQDGWQIGQHRMRPTLALDTAEARQAPLGQDLAASDHAGEGVLMCSRDGTTIAVIQLSSPAASSQTLLLLRLPE